MSLSSCKMMNIFLEILRGSRLSVVILQASFVEEMEVPMKSFY